MGNVCEAQLNRFWSLDEPFIYSGFCSFLRYFHIKTLRYDDWKLAYIALTFGQNSNKHNKNILFYMLCRPYRLLNIASHIMLGHNSHEMFPKQKIYWNFSFALFNFKSNSVKHFFCKYLVISAVIHWKPFQYRLVFRHKI